MIYIPAEFIREGMVIGRKLFGKSGETLLAEGAPIRLNAIEKIKELGYNGVFVSDKYTEGLEIEDSIQENKKLKAVKNVKELFAISQKKLIQMQMKRLLEQKIQTETIPIVEVLVDEALDKSEKMISIIDLKIFDDYTYYHAVNVTLISIIVGIELGLDRDKLIKLGIAGMLLDIGRAFLVRENFDRPDKLSKIELERMKQHTEIGYMYIKELMGMTIHTSLGVLQHHERLDGSGYPNKDTGEKITLFGKILSVADVYDALTSDRPYRKGMTSAQALDILNEGKNKLYEASIVEAMERKVSAYPVGTCVSLSNGHTGVVYSNFVGFGNRPLIKLIQAEKNKPPNIAKGFEFIDLRTDINYRSVIIKGVGDYSAYI